MGRYVLKRLIWMIPVILGVTILIFTIMYFCPGEPASIILGTDATDEQIQSKRDELGLSDPFFVQLANYLKNVFIKFDFGESYINGTSVAGELLARFPRTAMICAVCVCMAMLIGIPLGINAAIHQGGVWDTVSMIIALLGVSMPTFWIAQMLSLIFALRLRILPAIGYTSFIHYILPCVANSFGGIAIMARQTRSSMLEVIRSDYITTARAKGMSKRAVIFEQALPNALIPVITLAGTTFGKMLGGTIVIESVFSIPGIGSYLIAGINSRDYPVVRGSVVFLAILFSICMLLVDLVYAAVDPRIKAQYSAHKRRKPNGNNE